MGAWYTTGLALGLGLGLGVILTAILGVSVPGVAAALAAGTAAGFVAGIVIGDTPQTVAGAGGGFLGALCAAVVVWGALRRGGTRAGLAVFVGLAGVLVALLGLIPVLGYVEA